MIIVKILLALAALFLIFVAWFIWMVITDDENDGCIGGVGCLPDDEEFKK